MTGQVVFFQAVRHFLLGAAADPPHGALNNISNYPSEVGCTFVEAVLGNKQRLLAENDLRMKINKC